MYRRTRPTNCPTEYRSHKGEDPLWAAGAKSSSRKKFPSSARQLPILAALHARASTLFGPIIHQEEQKVNRFFEINDKFSPLICTISPIICVIIQVLSGNSLGYELLLLNGFITFVGLMLIRRK